MLRTYFDSMLRKVLQHFWFNNLTLQLPWFNLNLQFSSEVIHSNVQFVYLKVEKVIMRNANRVILTKSIHNIYVGLVKHMNIISLKGWILATVINFNTQIQGLLFSFDCQPPALHWLRQQFHVVFCIFCSSSVFFSRHHIRCRIFVTSRGAFCQKGVCRYSSTPRGKVERIQIWVWLSYLPQ